MEPETKMPEYICQYHICLFIDFQGDLFHLREKLLEGELPWHSSLNFAKWHHAVQLCNFKYHTQSSCIFVAQCKKWLLTKLLYNCTVDEWLGGEAVQEMDGIWEKNGSLVAEFKLRVSDSEVLAL